MLILSSLGVLIGVMTLVMSHAVLLEDRVRLGHRLVSVMAGFVGVLSLVVAVEGVFGNEYHFYLGPHLVASLLVIGIGIAVLRFRKRSVIDAFRRVPVAWMSALVLVGYLGVVSVIRLTWARSEGDGNTHILLVLPLILLMWGGLLKARWSHRFDDGKRQMDDGKDAEVLALLQSLQSMMDSMPVGIVGVWGDPLEVRLWNSHEVRRTGIEAKDVLGKPYLEEVAKHHVESTIAQAIRRLPDKVLHFPNVCWGRCKEGAVDVTVAPLRQGEKTNGYVIVLVDAVERNALHREGEESRRVAALGQFAAAIAHDIRTPLSSIRMSVQALRSKVELSAEDMEYFDITLEGISRIAGDVAKLLEYTSPALPCVQSVALGEIVEDAKESLATCTNESGVGIEVDVPGQLHVPVDEALIYDMLLNLLRNAVQATSPGGKVRLVARSDGDMVSIEVRDEGKGISSEDLDRIWDPFFTKRPDGTGLGLALVRKAVMAHGGQISVRSELGSGATFEVRIPARRSTEVLVPIEECLAARIRGGSGVCGHGGEL